MKRLAPEDFAFAAALAVAPVSMVGSAAGLYAIGAAKNVTPAWALIVVLDVPAIVGAASVRAGRRLALGWSLLLLGVVISSGLQGYTAWASSLPANGQGSGDLVAAFVHAILPWAPLLVFELAMPDKSERKRRRATQTAQSGAEASRARRPKPETNPAVAPPPPAVEAGPVAEVADLAAARAAHEAGSDPAALVLERIGNDRINRDTVRKAAKEVGLPTSNEDLGPLTAAVKALRAAQESTPTEGTGA